MAGMPSGYPTEPVKPRAVATGPGFSGQSTSEPLHRFHLLGPADSRNKHEANLGHTMPATNEVQLREALSALAAGQPEALRRVYDLTSARLYGKLLKLLDDPALASLALKRTYLCLWRNRSAITYAPGEEFQNIAALAHRTALEIRFRKADGEVETARIADLPRPGHGSSAQARLHSMDERDRAMLLAAYLQFETPEVMAKQFGMTPEDVRARLAALTSGQGGEHDG